MTAPMPAIEIAIAAPPQNLDPSSVFGSVCPVEVDVGSGKGRFLLARAAAHSDTGFIGIERQRRRVEKVAAKAVRAGLANIRLLHTEIRFAIEMLLPDRSIRAFYVFFPDPWPKRRHKPRRLINADFLKLIHRKLQPGGCIHFATDHDDYAAAVRPLFEPSDLFMPCPPFIPAPEEQTDFELLFAAAGKTAYRLSLQKVSATTNSHYGLGTT